jgi:predicted phage terminase large subunit-like protein
MIRLLSYSTSSLQLRAQAELERRRRVSALPHEPGGDLAAYVESTTPLRLEPWQRILTARLGQLRHQTGQRLLIHGPPQFGKSIIISQRFPAWLLGKAPLRRVRIACYNVSHAIRFSGVCLDLLRETARGDAVPPAVASKDEWSTRARMGLRDANPSMTALGLGTGFTGLGVDDLIIDDPYKNAQEARSPAHTVMLHDWWQQVVLSRLNPSANVVVMFHRWWEGDFAGWLIEQGGWEVLRFPALADGGPDDPTGRAPGEPLSPRFDAAFLADKRSKMGTAFEAMYQGTPYPAEGAMFKAGKAQFVDVAPAEAQWVRRWDVGATAGAGDYTVGVLMWRTDAGRYGIADVERGQWDTDDRDAKIRETAETDRSAGRHVLHLLPQDPGAAGKSQALAFTRLLDGFWVDTEIETGDKVTRADPLSSQWNAGNVDMVRAHWNKAFLDELLAFPRGRNDDQVDGGSGAYNRLATAGGWGLA